MMNILNKYFLIWLLFISIYFTPSSSTSCSNYDTETECNTDSRCGWSGSICTCADAVDQYIVFLMDASGSVGTNGWNNQKTFVITVIDEGISDGSLVGIVVYSSGIQFTREFTDDQTRSAITQDVNALPFYGGATFTRTALQTGINQIVNGATLNYPRLIVLLTDGFPNPSSSEDPCNLESQLIANDIILILIAVGNGNVNGFGLGCLLDDPASRGEILEATSFGVIDLVLLQLEVYTCPIMIDFEITEMKWSGDNTNDYFIELFNTGDQVRFDGTVVWRFGDSGSIRGDFFGIDGVVWAPETMLILVRSGSSDMTCFRCDCENTYGFSYTNVRSTGYFGSCDSSTPANQCCGDGHLYLPLGDSSTNAITGAYYRDTTQFSNTNFDVQITQTAAGGGTTIASVSYDSTFPAVREDHTFEKQSLFVDESSGANWEQSCWIGGTPGDDPVIPCTSTFTPTSNPTNNPTIVTASPSNYPSTNPTTNPTMTTLNPTVNPTLMPTQNPTIATASPSNYPSNTPTTNPTFATNTPSNFPSRLPTEHPTLPTPEPTNNPTTNPTNNPTSITATPTSEPTINPSTNPTFTTNTPTNTPTTVPTQNPTSITSNPTMNPTNNPTTNPTSITSSPTSEPSINPSTNPTQNPSLNPSTSVTDNPTMNPTFSPTCNPIVIFVPMPTANPTSNPTPSPLNCNEQYQVCIDVCDCYYEGDSRRRLGSSSSSQETEVSVDEESSETSSECDCSCDNSNESDETTDSNESSESSEETGPICGEFAGTENRNWWKRCKRACKQERNECREAQEDDEARVVSSHHNNANEMSDNYKIGIIVGSIFGVIGTLLTIVVIYLARKCYMQKQTTTKLNEEIQLNAISKIKSYF